MKKIKLGKIVDTHALKGELKIKSSFDHKDKAFKNHQELVLEDDKLLTVDTHRVHKNLDMLKFKEINSYDDAIKLKNKVVYIYKDSLNLKDNEYTKAELIGFTAIISDKNCGKLIDFIEIASSKELLLIKNNNKNYYYPYEKELVLKVDLLKKEIHLEYIEGLIE